MALIPPSFLDCVVAIGIENKKGETVWVASGFLYGYRSEPSETGEPAYNTFLVTNKHVFLEKLSVRLRFNPVGREKAREYTIDIVDGNGKPIWSMDNNPEIDVAVLPIDAQLLKKEGIQFMAFRNDINCADINKMKELGITEGDFVYVLGFPMELVGEGRNFVIVRSGSIARIRDMLDYDSVEYYLDTFIFPGNSGGPVISKPEVLGIIGTKTRATPSCLIGIVFGYLIYQDTAVSLQTKQPRVVFEENSGLARVHPVDYIEKIITQGIKDKVWKQLGIQ